MASRKTPNELRKDIRRNELRDLDALDEIHFLLDGTEWDCDTIEAIAEVIRNTGRNIREPQ